MKSSEFVIGMDGGGTKTAAMIADREGNVLAQHVSGPSNFQIIGVEAAAKTIFSLIRECCDSVKISPVNVRGMTIGLTGAGRPNDQKRMADGLRKFAASKNVKLRNINIESDARIALEGAFKGGRGIILIAGTGSIAFGKDGKGNVHRVGGWGRILGDEGSGYYIGKRALTAVCRHLDGRSEPTLLTRMIANKFALKTPTDIITAVYKNNFDVATMAPLVFDAAKKGDAASRVIVQGAADELAEHVRSLLKKTEPRKNKLVREKIPLSFIGGLIANDTLLSLALKRKISTSVSQITVITPMSPPVYGAVIMALS